MTNEQLAEFINAGGNDELIPLLWEKVKKLMYRRAGGYYRAFAELFDKAGVTVWDIKQAAYPAFLKAIEAYKNKGSGYKFTTFLRYPMQIAVKELIGSDPLNNSDSLNIPAYNDDKQDTDQLELVADDRSTEEYERIETADLCRTVRETVELLPEQYREVIKRRYYRCQNLREIAADMTLSLERVRGIESQALRKLRGYSVIRRLGDELGYTSKPITHDNAAQWKNHGITYLEKTAMERADITRDF